MEGKGERGREWERGIGEHEQVAQVADSLIELHHAAMEGAWGGA